MSSAKKKKIKDQLEDQQQGQLINKVNFQYKYWNSSLFNESYILNDLEIKHREIWHTDSVEFNKFFQRLLNLFEEYQSEEDYMNNWSETETISNWVVEVLDALGWDDNSPGKRRPYLEETSFTDKGKTLRPDILIVDNPDEKKLVKPKKGSGDLREGIRKVIVPVEVKYWNRLKQFQDDQAIDKSRIEKKDQDELSSTVSPNEQTIRYMNLLKRPWGILTDGAVWRLFHKDLSSDDSSRYYEFNLQTLFRQYLTADGQSDENEIIEAAKYFYFFFSKECLSDIATVEKTFCDKVLSYSKKYISGVQEDLKERFIDAMNICCNEYYKESNLEANQENLAFIRNVAESTLFNILFTKSLESRGVLRLSDRPYYAVSLSNIIDCIGGSIHPKFQYDPNNPDLTNERNLKISFKNSGKYKFNYSPGGSEIHDKIVRLTKIIHDGGSKANDFGFEIKGFKESIFDDEELEFFEENKVSNSVWVKILFQLAFIDSDVKGSYKFKQIPYAYFSPRELGEIYEGFLEWKLSYTKEDLVFEKKQWKKANLNSQKYRNTKLKIAKKDSLYFSPDNKERKDTGSYYTPDYIVSYIVEETLKPLCKGKGSNEIEKIKVCDPAMGSGHFLVSALNYLTDQYMQALFKESEGDVTKTPTEVKRDLLDKCIFGVDINPRAVKLAKMSLWLESAHPKAKLERLDDQLVNDNLLVNRNPWREYKNIKFSAFTQNPPYIGEKGHKELFQPVKNGWLGEFYQGKMDYFYFFMHAALELLKEGGRCGMITTNYYPTALGARKLRSNLRDRCQKIDLVQLNSNKVFPSASGQHNMISFFEKGNNIKANLNYNDIPLSKSFDNLYFMDNLDKMTGSFNFEGEESYIRIGGKSMTVKLDEVLSIILNLRKCKLGNAYNVNTGIQTGADKLSNSHIKKFNIDGDKGDGIFVLSNLEVKNKKIDKKYLKPFFKNSDVKQFIVNKITNESVIYLDHRKYNYENCSKNLKSHINRFYQIIERSVAKPPYLHRPRNEDIFLSEKIVVPQRSTLNTFGYNNTDWYAATDVFFITCKNEQQHLSLKALCGILNSKLYYLWLYFKGKRKGEALELIQKPLSEIPIPNISEGDQKTIEKVVDSLIKQKNVNDFSDLNKVIYKIFGLSNSQIKEVESFYSKKVGSHWEKEANNDQAIAA